MKSTFSPSCFGPFGELRMCISKRSKPDNDLCCRESRSRASVASRKNCVCVLCIPLFSSIQVIHNFISHSAAEPAPTSLASHTTTMSGSTPTTTTATTTKTRPKRILFIHPDLGIGGAERLVVDAAVGLQSRGHTVVIYTSHCDKAHAFDEARDGLLSFITMHNYRTTS